MLNLVIVAHPDDEILGFGAAGSCLAKAGETVQAVILCGDVDARTQRPSDEELNADLQAANKLAGFAPPVLGYFPNIRMSTVPHLDLVRFIEQQIVFFRPDRIFTHHPGDLNDDHLQTSRACLAASRLFQRSDRVQPLRSVHAIEIPSSTDWAFPALGRPFTPNLFFEVGRCGVEAKLAALACYRNVMREFPHPRSREVIEALAACRGAQAGMKYAEAFELLFARGL